MWPVRNLTNPLRYVTQDEKVTAGPYSQQQLESFWDVTDFDGQSKEKATLNVCWAMPYGRIRRSSGM